jgi:DNA-binding transcriptional LysR family regulator
MYLFWLTTFKKVVDERSYTRAAAALFISQSAASQQVRQIEKLFGAKLIQVVGREPHLTEVGKQVYELASKIEDEVDATRQRIDGMLGRSHSVVTIVSSTAPLVHRLPPVIRRFWAEHPEIGVKTLMRTGSEITDAVKTGFADLGIQTGYHLDKSLEAIPSWSDVIIGVVATEHSLARATAIQHWEIARQKIAISVGAEIRGLIDDWFEARGSKPLDLMELASFEEIRIAALGNLALGLLPSYVVSEDVQAGRLVQLDIQDFHLSRQTYLIHRKNFSKPASWLIEMLLDREFVAQNQASRVAAEEGLLSHL